MSDETCLKCKQRNATKSSEVYVGKKTNNADGTVSCTDVSKRELHTCTLCRAKERLGLVVGSVVIVSIVWALIMFTGGSPQSLREGSKDGFPLVAFLGPIIASVWEHWHFFLPSSMGVALLVGFLKDPIDSIATGVFAKEGLSVITASEASKFAEKS